MDKLIKKGQASPDFAMSAMIFSLAVLFVFFHISRTYYTKSWEVNKIEKSVIAENLALFLVSEEGNWSNNPFESYAIPFGGDTLNETRINYFFGMPYQTVQSLLKTPNDFKIEIWELPNIGITSDISEFYLNETVKLNFVTSENCTFYLTILGVQGATGVSLSNTTIGRYHNFEYDLSSGVYSLSALAISGNKFGAYEGTFRVIN